MNTPYPGFPPSYRTVDETGGYTRTCMVIEILSLGKLNETEQALLQEQLEACVEKVKRTLINIENTQVVLPNRFDPVLKAGLRLS